MKNIRLLLILFVLGIFSTSTLQANTPLEAILLKEAQKNLQQLSTQQVPAYYVSYRVYEITEFSVSGSFGELNGENKFKSCMLQIIVRVGSPELDNTHEIKSGGGGGSSAFVCEIPLENDEKTLGLILWSRTDQAYRNALQRYQNVKSNTSVVVASEDKSPDFSTEKSETYSVPALSEKALERELSECTARVKRYSAIFQNNKELKSGESYYRMTLVRSYFSDSDGAMIAQNSLQYRIGLNASTTADDGMDLPLYEEYFAHTFKDLPSDKVMEKEAVAISDMLSQLRRAPVVDSYAGPALLSAEATGVFFHEFFGHRIEGARLKKESDAQTFKKKIGEQVLSKELSVFFDPTLTSYRKMPLSGDYVFDDEGIRGRRVDIVKEGVLNSFLMSRTPIEGFAQSNGHGRGMIYLAPVTRQSNMIIESSSPKSDEGLRQTLRDELTKQGKPYGYLFGKVSGGFTNTNRIDANSFNVIPLIVYRVYADGRKDELVRGVNMIGTPLSMFAQIGACGKDYKVFNGFCGAESGSIPVSCVAPAMFVKMVETQRQGKSHIQPPILPRP